MTGHGDNGVVTEREMPGGGGGGRRGGISLRGEELPLRICIVEAKWKCAGSNIGARDPGRGMAMEREIWGGGV